MSSETKSAAVSHIKTDKNYDEYSTDEFESNLVGDTLEELFNDHQSGDFVLVGGFEPRRLAEYYIGQADSDTGDAKAQKMEEMVDMLVDRIFIVDSDSVQGQQMQLKLVNGVMHGAELWIKRDKGELELEIHAKTSRSKIYFDNNSEELKGTLEEALKESVKVNVVQDEEEQA